MISALVHLAFLCSHCETIGQAAEPQYALDIVVLPDGFPESELPIFRCATSVLTRELLRISPFSDSSKLLNIHRVDLIGEDVTNWVASGCTVRQCVTLEPVLPSECTAAPPSVWSRTYDGTGTTPAVSFGAKLCGGSKSRCEFLSVSDTALAAAVLQTAKVPAADLIVILVNVGTPGGVAFTKPMTYYVGTPPIAVVTMSGIDGDGCANILAHEIGHAFGLLDEYEHGGTVGGAATGPAPCGPNVTDPHNCTDAVPWDTQCTWKGAASCSNLAVKEECTANRSQTCCERAGGEYSELELPSDKPVALFEGGRYKKCGHFRPARSCRMRVNAEPFCAVCDRVIRTALPSRGENTLCLRLVQDREGISRWIVPGGFAAGANVPGIGLEDLFREHVDGSSIRRLRARVEIEGVPAWIPVREASIAQRRTSGTGNGRERVEMVLTRESDPEREWVRLRGGVIGEVPPRDESTGRDLPMSILVGPTKAKIRDLAGESWRIQALEVCVEKPKS